MEGFCYIHPVSTLGKLTRKDGGNNSQENDETTGMETFLRSSGDLWVGKASFHAKNTNVKRKNIYIVRV
jgi:hypothetical protein